MRLVWERLLDEHDATVACATVHRYSSAHPLKKPDTSSSHPACTAGNFLAESRQPFQAGVLKHSRALPAAIRQEPARHGLDGSYATTTAYILGLDAGTSWNMLTGFQEWLVVRLGRGHELTWLVLVRHLAPGGWVHPLTPRADTDAVVALHLLLSGFFDTREQPNGLALIFRNYQSWLTTQAWYQFEVGPSQINRDTTCHPRARDQID
ncbi:hypothetical protein [Embleya scabrispora]|uniref:hypothetical protein n=1 Tax=Embleya scabrispora TaxID=159449 RepID=UPI00036C4945|nr:hypothetical protein [Embleya scabrispora]